MPPTLPTQDVAIAAINWEEIRFLRSHLVLEPLEKLRRDYQVIPAFYVACDPFLPNFLRCLGAPGAVYPEACSHFRLRPLTASTESFFTDATQDPLRTGTPPLAVHLNQQLGEPIFGDFISREQIQSRGWFVQRNDDQEDQALLTVNYPNRSCSEDEWVRIAPDLRHRFQQLLIGAAIIRRGLQEISDRCYFPHIVKMMATLDRPFHPQPDATGDWRCFLPFWMAAERSGLPLQQLLTQILVPLEHHSSRWCATIHLLDDQRQELHLAAAVGDLPGALRSPLHLALGQGVVSWVALRRQAIRIRNLPESRFCRIHHSYLPDVRSQLAVPILAADRLLGTLSLEASEPDAFRFQPVGYLTRAASLVANALLLFEAEQVRLQRDHYARALNRELAKQVGPEARHIPEERIWEETSELPPLPRPC